jgi:hypothetical protein
MNIQERRSTAPDALIIIFGAILAIIITMIGLWR